MEVKPDEFLRHMQIKTEAAYLKSSLFRRQGYSPYQQAYIISYTPLRQGNPLVMGLHCHDSANKEGAYNPVVLERHAGLFRKFLGSDFTEHINYSNFCFFRAEHTSVSAEDLLLCAPLFKEYLRYVRPSSIIITDSAAYDAFRSAFPQYKEVRQMLIKRPEGNITSYVGVLQEYSAEPVRVVTMPLLESKAEDEHLPKLFRLGFNVQEETDSIPADAERIFEAGIDGGVETYYRFRRRPSDFLYFKKAIALEFEEDGQEHLEKKYYQLETWEDCWQSFTAAADALNSWLGFYPVYIHRDYVPYVQAAILSEKQRVHDIKESQMQDWLQKIKEGRYNEHRGS